MLSQLMHTTHSAALNASLTANGAFTFNSTLNTNLDFYSQSGNIAYPTLLGDFSSALSENADLAIRNILKMRDIRGGHGVRDNFRACLKHLAQNRVSYILETNILEKIIEVGRWDDVFSLLELRMPEVQNKIIKMTAFELNKGAKNSLVSKWLPLNGKKGFEKSFMSHLRGYMKLTPKELRNLVVKQRKDLVEVKMSAKSFDTIEYSHVPSRAMYIYRKAFMRHDPEGMAKFVEKAVNGEVKVNSSGLYPHEILKRISDTSTESLTQAQWDNLPDFIKGDCKIFPMVDVSGSMCVKAYSKFTCMDISIALGLYISERNKSVFKDLVLTFDDVPRFVSLEKCKSLADRYTTLKYAPWGSSTNLYGAFLEILNLAIENKISNEEMPEFLLVLTDMQYDSYHSGEESGNGFVRDLSKVYEKAGYKLPKVVWWNLCSRNGNTPVTFNEDGTSIVSGSSPALLEAVLSNELENYTPLNVMLNDLMSDRYKVTSKTGDLNVKSEVES